MLSGLFLVWYSPILLINYIYAFTLTAVLLLVISAEQWFPRNRHFFDVLWLYKRKIENLLILVVFWDGSFTWKQIIAQRNKCQLFSNS